MKAKSGEVGTLPLPKITAAAVCRPACSLMWPGKWIMKQGVVRGKGHSQPTAAHTHLGGLILVLEIGGLQTHPQSFVSSPNL